MDKQTSESLASFAISLKCLAHPVRLRMVLYLATRTEATVSEVIKEFDLIQAIVSMHLIELRIRGVLKHRKEGTHVYYRLASPTWGQVATMATTL